MNKILKIKIVGAGPTGSLLGIALSRIGCQISLLDVKNEKQIVDRDRAYALTHSSMKILKELDLSLDIEKNINSFQKLIVQDSRLRRRVSFDSEDISSINSNSKSIGWILNHNYLMDLLLSKVKSISNITLILGQKNVQDSEDYDLVIAADGIHSETRKSSGIKEIKFNYKQSCLTTKILIRNANSHTAYELLREEGPFAILPMGDDLYQIVWSASGKKCSQRLTLPKSILLDRIASIIPEGYEPDSILGMPNAFPISFFMARSFYKGKLILVGEAAHSFHPVGGQGLNLCWRDVHSITKTINLIQSKPKYSKLYLSIYSLTRFLDVIFVAISTDTLVRLFSNKSSLGYLVRRIVFKLMSMFSIVRKLIINLMTSGLYRLHN